MPLSPSDRVYLIGEISERLGSCGWHMIDLTLREFGAATKDQWHGNGESYVLNMLSGVPDACLVDLAHHFHLEFEPTSGAAEPKFWIKGYFRLFISHLAAHRALAGELKICLQDYGISAFVAHDDIEPATEWQNEIEAGLATADGLVALLHPGFHESKWTDQEVGYAMGRNVVIVSVRLGTDPYGFIGRYQGMNGNGLGAADIASRLFEILRKHRSSKARIAEGLVTLMEGSSTFKQAKANVVKLAKAECWNQTLTDRCLAAIEQNGQIQHAHNVPEQIRAIISKHSPPD